MKKIAALTTILAALALAAPALADDPVDVTPAANVCTACAHDRVPPPEQPDSNFEGSLAGDG